MSKVVEAVSSIFGGGDIEKPRQIATNASRVGGEPTPEQLAEQRAALAAQGRRPKQEELRKQQAGLRPLQGSASNTWI